MRIARESLVTMKYASEKSRGDKTVSPADFSRKKQPRGAYLRGIQQTLFTGVHSRLLRREAHQATDQLSQTQCLKLSLSLDDEENFHPNAPVVGAKRSFTLPDKYSKRRVISEPQKGGFIAAKMRERENMRKAYGAIHQSEVFLQLQIITFSDYADGQWIWHGYGRHQSQKRGLQELLLR